ncbi:hypothetical protein [Falsiroseomonas sp.]|uniref:hypothetical protein n=1 Tax=Falsiroseomonas sp. TaxID=2870721 RepID=UPI0034A24C6B
MDDAARLASAYLEGRNYAALSLSIFAAMCGFISYYATKNYKNIKLYTAIIFCVLSVILSFFIILIGSLYAGTLFFDVNNLHPIKEKAYTDLIVKSTGFLALGCGVFVYKRIRRS